MPDKVLAQYSKKYPNAWKSLENFFLSKGKNGLPHWPPYVFVPVAGAYIVISEGRTIQFRDGPDIAIMAALGAWSPLSPYTSSTLLCSVNSLKPD